MSDITKERDELVEMFGVHFQNVHNLPPLGSRIFATLILDSYGDKVSFEDLVERMGASKSSVSTNLNLLLKIGKIEYYTQPGDRKKYYKPAPFSYRFDNYLKMIAYEKKIIEKMHSYRQKTSSTCPGSKYELEKIKVYEQHMLDMEQLILKSINEFRELEKNDPI